MGTYIAARSRVEGVLIYAPMEAFAVNSLVGTYSSDVPYFKLTGQIHSVLCSVGYVIEQSGKVFSVLEVVALYGALYRKLMEVEGRVGTYRLLILAAFASGRAGRSLASPDCTNRGSKIKMDSASICC